MGLTCRDKELKDEIFQNELIISVFHILSYLLKFILVMLLNTKARNSIL